MATRRQTENAFHCHVAEFLDKALPREFLHCCFPAGGGGAIRGAWLKRRGLRPGIPDHFIIAPEGWPKPVLWLELKTKKGRPSEAQLAMHALLRGFGHQVEIVRDLEAVQLVVEQYVYPMGLRASVSF